MIYTIGPFTFGLRRRNGRWRRPIISIEAGDFVDDDPPFGVIGRSYAIVLGWIFFVIDVPASRHKPSWSWPR